MTEGLGRRTRKKIERRRQIEEVALDLFATHGFDETTVEDIATGADIAPRTFFHYFPTKEDVVLADYADRLERITVELAQQSVAEDPWHSLRAAFEVVATDYAATRDQLLRRFEIMAANPAVYARSLQLQAGWEDTIADVLTSRPATATAKGAAADLDARLMASAALACMRASLRHWLASGQDLELPELMRRCFDRFATGLTTGR